MWVLNSCAMLNEVAAIVAGSIELDSTFCQLLQLYLSRNYYVHWKVCYTVQWFVRFALQRGCETSCTNN